MGNEISKFTRRMTDEACEYAMREMACNKKISQVVREVKDKFDITISAPRLIGMSRSNKWGTLYDAVHEEYLKKLKDYSGIAIATQRTRLEDAEKMRQRINRIIEKLEAKIDEHPNVGEYEIVLIRELRMLTETYFKALKYGKSETDDKPAVATSSNSLQDFLKRAKNATIVDAETVDTPQPEEGLK